MILKKPIIIISPGRSGSTILSELLFQHQDLAWPSNYHNKFPEIAAVNRLRGIFQNKFWDSTGTLSKNKTGKWYNKFLFKQSEGFAMWDYLTGKDIDFSKDFLFNERASVERKEFIRLYFENLVKLQGKKRLALKLTGPSRLTYLASIFPDAKFIYIKREPIATVNSFVKADFWKKRGLKELWWKGAYSKKEVETISKVSSKPYSMTAYQLKKLFDMHIKEVNEQNVDIMEVYYEDFVEGEADIVREILKFTGLASDVKIENTIKKTSLFNGNSKLNLAGGERDEISKIFST